MGGEGRVQINQYFYIPETFLHLAETRCPHLGLLYVYGGLDLLWQLNGFVGESVQNLAGKHWVYLHVNSVFGDSLLLYYVQCQTFQQCVVVKPVAVRNVELICQDQTRL